MRRLLPTLANGLWYLSSLPESRAFARAQLDPADAQEKALRRILMQNEATAFGRQFRFASIRSVAEYQERVPLSTYEDYAPAIQRIGEGERAVLTADPVLLLELTSGSASASKQIPYTEGLKAEFQRGIAPWIADLFRHDPRLLTGQAYWSVTPVAQRHRRTPGGIPIGFEEDTEYLSGALRGLVQAVMAVPPQVKLIGDMEAFRYVTLLFLLRSRSLTLLSVWNPTFPTLLMAPLDAWWRQLASDICTGRLTPPGPIDPDLLVALRKQNRPDPRRAAEIHAAFRGEVPGPASPRLWPNLRLISCWTEAGAAPHVEPLRELFPHTRIQGKGLIATEGFVTLPLERTGGCVPALRSHFLEFLPEGGGAPRLVQHLEPGGRYSVVLTTGGGLYRYRLHDLVEVTGRYENCPLLKFVGKEAHISDNFGEKVNEQHVSAALARIFAAHGIRPTFAMVACEGTSYTLFVEASGVAGNPLASAFEEALLENYHYAYCRQLGQLQHARVFHIRAGAQEAYLRACQAQGQRLGDIKPATLHRMSGWAQIFDGDMV